MVSLATKHNDPEAKLGWNERIGFGIGGFGFNMINAVMGSFLTIYFTNAALLDAAIVSSIVAVSKLLDGISDLIVGNIVDRTKSPLGKGRAWLVRMCIPLAIATVLLFNVPQNAPDMVKYVYVFIFYNLVNAVFLTFVLVPFYSMISLISRNAYERGMLGNVQQIFQTLGNVVINSVFVAMLTRFTDSTETIYTQRSFTITMIIICAVMVLVTFICVLCTKERVKDDKKSNEEKGDAVNPITSFKALLSNRYWVIMFFANFVIFFVIIMYSVGSVFYAQYIYQDMSLYSFLANAISIAQFAIMFATPFFMKKFGKAKIYTFGILVLSIGFLGFGLFADGGSLPMIIIFNVLKGCGIGMAGGMAMGMVADTITYGKLKTGVNAVGMGNAALSAAQKLGLGLGTAVFGWVMDGAGFDGALDLQGIAQPAAVADAIRVMYSWVPLVMSLVIFALLLVLYDIDKKLPAMLAEAEKAEQN